MKMNLITAVFVVVACLIVQAAESKEDLSLTTTFSRVARSIHRRQINALGSNNCTQVQLENIFDGYPPDCPSVNLTNGVAVFTNVLAGTLQPSALCAPQCNPAIARYFSECFSGAFVEVFIRFCGTNANNESCYNLTNTLVADAATVQLSCPTSGSSCPSSCQSSILSYRNNSGCCVNVFNSSIFNNFPGLATFAAANNNSLWVSCSVETPGLCQSTVSRPGSLPGTTSSPTPGTTSSPTSATPGSPTSGTTNTQYPLSKLFTGLLLGVVMVLTL